MGEYVRVTCSKCKKLLDEAWVEEIDKTISIDIIPDACDCSPDEEKLYDDGYDAGYEEGFQAGKEEAESD